jgi:hypothetical protein
MNVVGKPGIAIHFGEEIYFFVPNAVDNFPMYGLVRILPYRTEVVSLWIDSIRGSR